jgi:hypothetical protein
MITHHLHEAIKSLEKEVEAILLDTSLSLTQKDPLILLCAQKKRVLLQALEDISYLEANPPEEKMGCEMHRHS